jgi:acyl carrier protein
VSVETRVMEIVSEHLAVAKDKLTRQTNFIEDIGADSLDIVELVMELEEEFDIQIPDDQAEKIKTVGEAIDYIEAKQKEKGADGGAKA